MKDDEITLFDIAESHDAEMRDAKKTHHPECGLEALRAKGPARVSSRAYREGWESIFGTRTKVGES